MDDRVKVMCYEFLCRKIMDEENELRRISDRMADRSFPAEASDYTDYACMLSRKVVLQEVFSGLCSILSYDFPE